MGDDDFSRTAVSGLVQRGSFTIHRGRWHYGQASRLSRPNVRILPSFLCLVHRYVLEVLCFLVVCPPMCVTVHLCTAEVCEDDILYAQTLLVQFAVDFVVQLSICCAHPKISLSQTLS